MTKNLASLYPEHIATLKQRYDRALAASGSDHLVVAAGSLRMIFLDDMPYPFKVNPHFKVWVPVLNNPECFLIYTPGKKPRLLYHQPVDFWHKSAGKPEGYWVEQFDITMMTNPEEAKKHLPANLSRTAFVGEWDDAYEAWGFQNPNPEPLINRLHFERSAKTEYEIECMRLANALGAGGHRAAEEVFRNGGSEFDIHVEYLRATQHMEQELPYNNIICLNEHASVLHYWFPERKSPPERHSFLIDAGASFNGYASDITRTYSAKKDEFQSLIDALEDAQQEICGEVKIGLDYRELHIGTHRKVAKILAEFGFVKLSAEEIFDKAITSTFFPHGLGHFIGLQVHDVAGFMADESGKTIEKPVGHGFLRLTRKVEENQSFTIEPGIYFIEPLLATLKQGGDSKHIDWKKVDAFRKFGGIRIEDDIIVREKGIDNLTRQAFAG